MKKITLFIGLMIIFVAIAYQVGLVDLLTDIDQLRLLLADFGWWGYVLFIGLGILVAVLMLPGQFLAVVGGLIYGGWLGGALTIIGASIGCTISFMIGKFVARDYVIQRFSNSQVFQKIEKGVAQNGVSFLIFTRLVPIFPYGIQSYAYALTPMTVGKFSAISFVTMMPASFIYAFMASEIATKGVSLQLLGELALAGMLLSLLSFVPKKILSSYY
ncbi:TVP38/TMEM64 family protein [Vagococcus sp. BWB3-3]|uniref:TVP38/TMEM64 family membrane protein n=1 Tax=Vagococcus allomyrinae TaxID=2794353 RepID=A0A940SSP3_9ENTE|nr:TVP38/TMEM64 family protein [Vagococcus allomyrinae]MBP1042192.1 TVP38/TMEM64 family protein [Vagococcus allomyrinae]